MKNHSFYVTLFKHRIKLFQSNFLFFVGFIKSVPDKLLGLSLLVVFMLNFIIMICIYFEYFGCTMFIGLFNFFVIGMLFYFCSILASIVLLVFPGYLKPSFYCCSYYRRLFYNLIIYFYNKPWNRAKPGTSISASAFIGTDWEKIQN